MNCEQAREWFGLVWDLPENDPERLEFEAHLADCERCAEEFRIWEESELMLRRLPLEEPGEEPDDRISRSVMERIYREDFWLMPIKDHTYRWSDAFRRGMSAAMACFLAMFVCAFVYMAFGVPEESAADEQIARLTGMIDTISSIDGAEPISIEFYQDMPVASISGPVVLTVIPTYPHYWIALSILGMIMTLLTINWFTRTRS
jgi:hypothetical protein